MDDAQSSVEDRERKLSDTKNMDESCIPTGSVDSSVCDQDTNCQIQTDEYAENDHELDDNSDRESALSSVDAQQNTENPVTDAEAQHMEQALPEDECSDVDTSTEPAAFPLNDQVKVSPTLNAPHDTGPQASGEQQCLSSNSPDSQTSRDYPSIHMEHDNADQELDRTPPADVDSGEAEIYDPPGSEVTTMSEGEPDSQTTAVVESTDAHLPPNLTDLQADTRYEAVEVEYEDEVAEVDSDNQSAKEFEGNSPKDSSPPPVGLSEDLTHDPTTAHQYEASGKTVNEKPEILMTAEVSYLNHSEDLQDLPESTNYESVTTTEHAPPNKVSHEVNQTSPILLTGPVAMELVPDEQVCSVEMVAVEEHGDVELVNTVLTASEAFEHVPMDEVTEIDQGDGLGVSIATECVTVHPVIMQPNDGLPCDSAPLSVSNGAIDEPEVAWEDVKLENAVHESEALKPALLVDTTVILQPVSSNTDLPNNTSPANIVEENGRRPSYSAIYDADENLTSTVAMKSRTLDMRPRDQWDNRQLQHKVRAATLGPSGSRKRIALRPKPAVNDDHLFPDSVTPTKVEPLLSAHSVSMGLPDGTYDLPYMDDDAFLRRRRRDTHDAKNSLSDDESINGSVDGSYMWMNTHIDPEHLANTDECAATPLITPKNKKMEENKGKRRKMDKTNGRKLVCIPAICGCISKRRGR